MNYIRIWNICLKSFKNEISAQEFKTWFQPIKPLKYYNNILTVRIPSEVFYMELEMNYINLLRKVLKQNYGHECRLEYSILLVNPIYELKFNAAPQIIKISSKVNDKLVDHLSKNPKELKTIDRRLFEELIAELFDGFGFDVELTQKTRDGGVDIIAIKNDQVKMKYLIECKRPDPDNPVGIKPVRELFGVKNDNKATKAILATTTYFSKEALMFFEKNKWELEPKDFSGILEWIEDYKRFKKIN